MKQNEARAKRQELRRERKRQGFCFFLEKEEKRGLIPEVKAMV